MRFLRFQVNFGHSVSHCQCNKICPKLLKSVQKQLVQGTLKFQQKLRFWFFSKTKTSMCRRGTKACAQCLDFQYKNFLYAFFNVKKKPLYVSFNQGCLYARLAHKTSAPTRQGNIEYIQAYSSIFEVFFKNIQRICPICPVCARCIGQACSPTRP
jgi:hypothetical protein